MAKIDISELQKSILSDMKAHNDKINLVSYTGEELVLAVKIIAEDLLFLKNELKESEIITINRILLEVKRRIDERDN